MSVTTISESHINSISLPEKNKGQFWPYETLEGKEEEETRQEHGVFCTFCGEENQKESNFCVFCGNKLTKAWPENTGDTDSGAMSDDTIGLIGHGYDAPEKPVYPTLIRLSSGESFYVSKPTFRIGAEQRFCDLFIGDNPYISRSHADIVARDGRYYIIDRNSTNKTYVNGSVIPAEKEVALFAGTQIRLANEDFYFNIES